MANGLKPLAGLCGLLLLGVSCSSDPDSDESSAAGAPTTAGSGGATTSPTAAHAGKNATAGTGGREGEPASAGMTGSAGAPSAAGSAAKGGTGASDPPPAVNGHSIYALECHGDSKDCNLATVPCFGVGSPTPNVAAGWACANRCKSSADCSDAPSGAEAKASCVSFASAGHCVLVCQNENQAFACPDGMGCYVPDKSPIGYCLWQ